MGSVGDAAVELNVCGLVERGDYDITAMCGLILIKLIWDRLRENAMPKGLVPRVVRGASRYHVQGAGLCQKMSQDT